MQELRQVQSRSQTLNGNNNAVSGNNAGTVDESGFSYRDLLQQFQDQSQNSAREREQDTPTPSKQPTPIKEISAEAMLNNLSFMSGSYNASSRAVLGSGAGKNAESQKVLMGDFNDDGILDTDDVMAIQDHIVEKKKITDPNMLKRMDLNSDGEIDVFDLTKLTNTIIGREDKKFLEKNGPMKGDLNSDGVIDSTDSDLMVDIVMKDRLKQGAYSKAADFDDDGKISVADLSTFNQTLSKIKAANSTGIKGDINNDGEVTVSDINLLDNFFRGKIRSAHIYNEDVNGDGELNKDDLESVRNFIMHEKLQKLSGVQGDINNDGKVSLIDVARLQNYVDGNIERSEVYNEDVNGDGKINKADVDAVEKLYLFKGKFQENNGVLGDINNDGKVDAEDLNRLNQHLDGKINYANVNNEDVNGDGRVDRNDARNLSNLIQYGKMETPTGINGDINNDGKVDSTDIDKLNDLLAGRENHVNVYNANVNGDNAVDQNDVAALENLINYGTINKPEPAPPPPPPAPEPYRQWQSVATARVDVYTDSGLTNHLGNEKVFAGDPLDVLDETDNAYLVRYGVGTYPNYSSYKERWIEKWAIDGANKPVPVSNETPAYEPWRAVIANRVPAYQDSGLSIRHGNEEVWVGDPVDVLNETDNAYFVRYGVGTYPNYTDYKERWISKNAISGVNQVNPAPAPSYQPWQATVQTRMPAYHDANLTDRRNNEEVWVGDNVTILDETDRAYKMRYWSTSINDYKERWVDKAALNAAPAPAPAPSYQPWQATVQTRMPAYHDANLTDRRNDEEVWVGDNVTILDETDRAYKMRYWSTAANDYKERWVDKAALSGTTPSVNPVTPIPPNTPVANLSVSNTGIALIKRWEGFKEAAYKPYSHEKYYTIGYGHYGPDVSPNMVITEEQAEAYLRQDLATAEAAVKRNCAHLNLNQNQYDALVSFTFNCGEGNLKKLVRDGRSLEEIADSLPYYRNAGGKVSQGLVNRRADELALFNTPVTGASSVAQVSPNTNTAYQPWQATVQTRMPAYHDEGLTDRRNNEEVWVGDNVTILDENDRAYKMRYWSDAANAYKERWVDKAALAGATQPSSSDRIVPNGTVPVNPFITPVVRPTNNPTSDTTYSTEKAGWTATALYKKQVFNDSDLKNPSKEYEGVSAKERVTILAENDKAYQIRYWSTKINGYKERWIDKAALSEPTPPVSLDKASSDVQGRMLQLNKNVAGFRDGDVFKGEGYCRGFAVKVYKTLFGLSIDGYSNYNYAALNYPGSYVAGQLYNFGKYDTNAVQQLFANILPGAIVQMGRRDRLNSSKDAAAPHTAIVYSVDPSGVDFYEANVVGSNVIKIQHYTWEELAKANEGFTIYLPNSYS